VIALALLPLRSSLGVAGSCSACSSGSCWFAVIGGWRPAVAATVLGFLLADFLYTRPYYSLQITQAVDVVALIVFAVVAVVVGALIDVLTRQGVQVARARGSNRTGAPARGAARLRSRSDTGSGERPEADLRPRLGRGAKTGRWRLGPPRLRRSTRPTYPRGGAVRNRARRPARARAYRQPPRRGGRGVAANAPSRRAADPRARTGTCSRH